MAASMTGNVDVKFDNIDSGSDADSEVSDDLEGQQLSEDGEAMPEKKGLADVFAKILHKNVPSNKQVILAKGKTDRQIQKRKLEAEQEDEEKSAKKSQESVKISAVDIAREEKAKLWENMCRVKPDPLQRDRERKLQKIATRGVVQLFNAVRQQQKTIDNEIKMVGSSERKKDKVMESMTKDKFLNILKGSRTNVKMEPSAEKKIVKEENESAQEAESVSEKKWDILRDDYMMGAKMKDWDKQGSDDNSDDDDDGSEPGDPDISDSD